jgi:hypothetical protein
MLVASVVRHVSTTWSPAVMVVGVAVNCAVGDGPLNPGAVPANGFDFLPQPTTAATKTRLRNK